MPPSVSPAGRAAALRRPGRWAERLRTQPPSALSPAIDTDRGLPRAITDHLLATATDRTLFALLAQLLRAERQATRSGDSTDPVLALARANRTRVASRLERRCMQGPVADMTAELLAPRLGAWAAFSLRESVDTADDVWVVAETGDGPIIPDQLYLVLGLSLDGADRSIERTALRGRELLVEFRERDTARLFACVPHLAEAARQIAAERPPIVLAQRVPALGVDRAARVPAIGRAD